MEAGPGGYQRGRCTVYAVCGVRTGWSRQRTSEAKLHARRAADKAAGGRHGLEELDQAPPGPGGARTGRFDPGVVAKLKLEGRRQAMLHRRLSKPSAAGSKGLVANVPRRDRESGGTQGARVESRLQKSGRRICLAGTVRRGATREDPGSGGIARSDPPAFDGAGGARGERQGAR